MNATSTRRERSRLDDGLVYEIFVTSREGDDLSDEMAAMAPTQIRWSQPDSAPLLHVEATREDVLRLRLQFLKKYRGAVIRIFEVPFVAHEKWCFADESDFVVSDDGLTFVIPGNPKVPPIHASELHAILAEAREMLPAHRDALYKNIPDFILREGQGFSSASLSAGERKVVGAAWGRKAFAPKYCFSSARRLVLADSTGTLEYVEGYITGMIHHAWATLGGKVVDPTLRDTAGELTSVTARRARGEYIGVRIRREYLLAATRRREEVAILDDWKRNFPILHDTQATWRPDRS